MQKIQLETNTCMLLEHERNYRHHIARLSKISGEKKTTSQQIKTFSEHDRLLQRGQDSLRRKQTQRLLDIQKDNDRILGNLLRITQRKDPKLSKSQPKVANQTSTTGDKNVFNQGKPKSLNYVNRKNDILKILNENVKITGRLIFQESTFSKNKLEKDYKQHKQYSNRIRKIKVNPDRSLTLGHGGVRFSRDMRLTSHAPYLPPLQPTFLTSKDPCSSFRSSSVPKLQVTQMSKTQRSTSTDVLNRISTGSNKSHDLKNNGISQNFVSQQEIGSITNSTNKTQHLKTQENKTEDYELKQNSYPGHVSERINRNSEVEKEIGRYTHKTYITYFPSDEGSPQQEDNRKISFVKEESQDYEEEPQNKFTENKIELRRGSSNLQKKMNTEESQKDIARSNKTRQSDRNMSIERQKEIIENNSKKEIADQISDDSDSNQSGF